MKKRLLIALLLFLTFSFTVRAQNTNVSATVTDAGGQAWVNGSYTFNFITAPRFNGTYRLNGSPYTPVSISGSLDGTGTLTSIPIPDNNLITPASSQWTLTVCAQARFVCFTSNPLTITGASQNITSNVIPPAISVNCGPGAVAYVDTEVGCSIGGQYYNLTTQINRQCQAVTGNACTTWANSGGGGAASPNTPADKTVATLPGSPATGDKYVVTDGTGLSCTVGGASTKVLCRWNGASWDVVNFITGKTGQIDTAVNGASPRYQSVGLPDGNGGAVITTTSYVIKCDTATDAGGPTTDRGTTLRFQSGASVITAPDHTAAGCDGNFPIVLINDGAGTLTVNRSGSDTFTVIDGSTNTDGATSFTFGTGQSVNLNNGSGTVWEARVVKGSVSGLTTGFIPKAASATSLTNSLCDEAITTANTITCTDTAGLAAPKFTSTGTTAGFVDYPQGTDSGGVAPCNAATSICEEAPTVVTSYKVVKPGVAAQGTITNVVTAAVDTQGFSGDTNHSAVVTIGSGTSIGSTSLCSTANCPVGTYRVNVYIDITTACGTSGTYIVNLIYTDDQGSKTIPVNINGSGTVPATGTLTTTSTANFGENSQIIRSTGAASINYSTTAVACGTAGPMVGKLYLSVEPVQ